MTVLLEVQGLAKTYGGVEAVKDVSLTVAAGEMVALIGPNGAGKSTCFNMIHGQIKPDHGSIRLFGRETAGMRPAAICRLGVGRTFQITATFASMRVVENLQVALASHDGIIWRRFARLDRYKRTEAQALLDLVGIGALADHPCGELAYGDLKRLELAVALSNEPRLLLMDEPTAGMAPGARIAMMALAAGIARQRGIGILFTEHDMDVVFEHADRLLVLDRGRLIAAGDADTVRNDPQVRAVYLGDGTVFASAAIHAKEPAR
ncbi:ABC transporter ATP-binding protein [Labrys neptuniae]|uniref:ABC transporter ATP-binding protein n=1 Tax=Labrys neptuniae TaxID=376174 RepID=UPI00288FE37D|nr:ABC transporter ATP-binding protein [Labrys neptuniae]MDT3378797.1 ABC transporter ATP-binding protein [Labrys neptuniae]